MLRLRAPRSVAPFSTLLLTAALNTACTADSHSSNGSDAAPPGENTGGAQTSAGGTVASGGARAGGAQSSAGGTSGTTNTGGRNATGGTANTGGRNAIGGITGTGGLNATGGTANTGGRNATGGTANTGGRNATGGTAGQSTDDAGTPKTIDHLVTFYGWPDNDPAGNGIAYPKLHKGASGTGTYADPITFATDPKEWAPGTILYVPYLKRYVIMEDSCAECITDWAKGKYHIDLWLDSTGTFDDQVIKCEDTLTRDKTSVQVNPPSNLPVDATPLFDTTAGTCNPP